MEDWTLYSWETTDDTYYDGAEQVIYMAWDQMNNRWIGAVVSWVDAVGDQKNWLAVIGTPDTDNYYGAGVDSTDYDQSLDYLEHSLIDSGVLEYVGEFDTLEDGVYAIQEKIGMR